MDPDRVELPNNFQDAPVDHLVQLIGTNTFRFNIHGLTLSPADMLERLMSHNDHIPLSP